MSDDNAIPGQDLPKYYVPALVMDHQNLTGLEGGWQFTFNSQGQAQYGSRPEPPLNVSAAAFCLNAGQLIFYESQTQRHIMDE